MANPTVTIEIKEMGAKQVLDKMILLRQEAGKLVGANKRISRTNKKLSSSTQKVSSKFRGLKGRFTELGKSASLALGPLNGVAARLTAFSGLATGAGLRIAGFIGALVGAGGIVFAATRAAKSLDTIRKSAERTGLPIETFQEFAFAASQLSGIDLPRFTQNMEAFTRRLADAKIGSGEAADAFRLLFGSLDKIQDLSPEQALLKTADAFRGLQREAQGAGVAADLFSRRGLTMVQFLNKGSKGIKEMARQARTLGLVFSESLVKQGTRTTDALDKMSRVLSINLLRSVTVLLPTVERLAIVFAKLGPIIKKSIDIIVIAVSTLLGLLLGGLFGPIGAGIGAALGAAFGIVITKAEQLIEVIEQIEAQTKKTGSGFDAMKKSILDSVKDIPAMSRFSSIIEGIFDVLGTPSDIRGNQLKGLKDFLKLFVVGKDDVDALDEALGSLNTRALDFKGARKSLAALSNQLEQIRAQTITLLTTGDRGMVSLVVAQGQARKFLTSLTNAQITELAASIGITVDELAASVIAVNKGIIGYKELGKVFENTRTPVEKLNLEMTRLVAIQKEFPLHAAIVERSLDKIKEKMLDINGGVTLLEDAFGNLGDTIVSSIREGINVFEGLVNVLNDTLEQILKLIVQLTIINPLLNDLFGGTRPEGLGDGVFGQIGSAVAGLFGGGVGGTTSGLSTALGSGVSPVGSDLISFAHGGSFDVKGKGGVDANFVPLALTAGENVKITPAGAQGGDKTTIINLYLPPGMTAREFGDSDGQIGTLVAGTISAAAASNN